MEIILTKPDSLQALLYPTQGEGLDNLEFYAVKYLYYVDPNGKVFLKGKDDWGTFNIGASELEDIYWVNIDTEFVEVFDKAQADGQILYLEDVNPYSKPSEIFTL